MASSSKCPNRSVCVRLQTSCCHASSQWCFLLQFTILYPGSPTQSHLPPPRLLPPAWKASHPSVWPRPMATWRRLLCPRAPRSQWSTLQQLPQSPLRALLLPAPLPVKSLLLCPAAPPTPPFHRPVIWPPMAMEQIYRQQVAVQLRL